MNFKLPLIAAFVGALSLSACGGGSNSSTPTTSVSSPASLVINDITVGTGATVTASSSVTINYTISLYKADAANFTGTQIMSSNYALAPVTDGSQELDFYGARVRLKGITADGALQFSLKASPDEQPIGFVFRGYRLVIIGY